MRLAPGTGNDTSITIRLNHTEGSNPNVLTLPNSTTSHTISFGACATGEATLYLRIHDNDTDDGDSSFILSGALNDLKSRAPDPITITIVDDD